MNKILTLKNFYFIIALLSFFTLASAIYIEYVLGVKACKLCLYQRAPYMVAILLCFFGYSNLKKPLWIYLLAFNFLVSLILAGYHSGIENNLFPEFSGCTATNLNIIDKEELINSLGKNLPNCKDVVFKIIGFSLATINLFISLVVFIISLLFIKNEKNR
tara:strand:+ start:120 stop:599 length:480 start_codon:yes stop_codon:yes gene_type:complete